MGIDKFTWMNERVIGVPRGPDASLYSRVDRPQPKLGLGEGSFSGCVHAVPIESREPDTLDERRIDPTGPGIDASRFSDRLVGVSRSPNTGNRGGRGTSDITQRLRGA